MRCSYCGHENPNGSLFCNQCGKKVITQADNIDIEITNKLTKKEIMQDERYKTEENLSKNHVIKLLIITSVILVFSVLFVFFSPLLKYKKAIFDRQNGKYESAILAFAELNEYKDSVGQINETKYEWAKKLIEEKEFLTAIGLLNEIFPYQDSQELMYNAQYCLGNQYLLEENYSKAISCFTNCKAYCDSDTLLTKCIILENFQGDWVNIEDSGIGIQINGTTVIGKYSVLEDAYLGGTIKDNKYIVTNYGQKFYIDEDGFLNSEITFNSGNKSNDKYKRGSISKHVYKTPPQIGMTAKEVENSLWGLPMDINKTTTTYGISEQWVYSGNRYIYLDDGIVTAIQD